MRVLTDDRCSILLTIYSLTIDWPFTYWPFTGHLPAGHLLTGHLLTIDWPYTYDGRKVHEFRRPIGSNLKSKI